MKILIIGLGSIAQKHISSIRSLKLEADIFALRSSPTATDITEGVTNVYRLDKTDTYDFAIVSNPTSLHGETIAQLADLRIPMFIEKPPLSTLINSDLLLSKIKENNVPTYVACNLRFHPCIVFLKDYLTKNSSKKINEVNVYCGSYLPDWRPHIDFRENYSARPELGGGVHLDLFHELDYTFWLFGKPTKTQCLQTNKSSLEIEAIDYANYNLQYKNFTANIILNYFRRDPKRNIEILFDETTLNINLIKNEISNHHGDVLFTKSGFNIQETYDAQMASFVENLINNTSQINTFSDSLDVLKSCLSNGNA